MKLKLLPVILILALFACKGKSEEKVFKKSTIIMDTVVSAVVVADTPQQAEAAIDMAFGAIKRLERLISFWDPGSEISTLNKAAGTNPVTVSPETLLLMEKAIYVSEHTGGAFDPTIGPLIRLWDFKKKIRPDAASVKKTLPLVDYRAVVLDKDKSTAFLAKKGISFDTGGIAKGYAADIAEKTLKDMGIKAGLISVAGDIKTFGVKPPGGKGWRVAIKIPDTSPPKNEKETKIKRLLSIDLHDEAVSTSGDYERFFFEGGVRYHHILNPKTGMPARGCRGVSVVASNAALADGFATALFVMGVEKGLKKAEELGLGAIFVDDTGAIHATKNLRDRIIFHRNKPKPAGRK